MGPLPGASVVRPAILALEGDDARWPGPRRCVCGALLFGACRDCEREAARLARRSVAPLSELEQRQLDNLIWLNGYRWAMDRTGLSMQTLHAARYASSLQERVRRRVRALLSGRTR